MRLLKYFAPDGGVRTGIRDNGQVYDLGGASMRDIILGARPERGEVVDATRLDAPLRDVPKLLALAGNYRKHVVESGFTPVPERGVVTPQVFMKPPSTTINRPGGVIPLRAANVFLDWEIELAVVIGAGGRDIPVSGAMHHVFGYTAINDISERQFNARLENREKREFDPFFDWLLGKWFDGSAPIGPEIVTSDEIPDPHTLGIKLWVNDQLMQDSNTSLMIFSVPETIAYISSVVTLEPGDIIAMGTPEGVGSARGIQLRPGDRVRGEIENIGILENVVEGAG